MAAIKYRTQFNHQNQFLSLKNDSLNLSDEWAYLCETIGEVLTGEGKLPEQTSEGLAVIAYSLGDRTKAFEQRLRAIRQTPKQRFSDMIQRCPMMSQYYDEAKEELLIEKLWEGFESLQVREKIMLTFVLMVWNPLVRHTTRSPLSPSHAFFVLRGVRYLLPEDKRLIVEWIENPFHVLDDQGSARE